MKVLWICNVMFPEVAKRLGMSPSSGGGWQLGLLEAAKGAGIQLSVCLPTKEKDVKALEIDGVHYYTYYQKTGLFGMSDFIRFSRTTMNNFLEIINKEKPDILQVFGTEYPHCLQAIKAFGNPKRTVVHIQGLLYKIAESYYAGLPQRVIKQIVPSTLFRGTIYKQRIMMEKRALIEKSILLSVDNVVGRTEWDLKFTTEINENINYYKCNELLRDSFYEGEWQRERCIPRSLFVSQGTYPIKGLHKLLEAVAILKHKHCDIKLYVAGNNPLKDDSIKGILTISSYGRYLKELIRKLNLKDNIIFTGTLSEKEIKQHLLSCNAFVLPSMIENSSNSLSEAMLLGVPCIAADTGGTSSILSNNEGFLYDYYNVDCLANIIDEIFCGNPEIVMKKSVATRNKAKEMFDRNSVGIEIKKIYEAIFDK